MKRLSDDMSREKLAALRQQLAGRLVGNPTTSQPTGLLKTSLLPLGLGAIDAHLGGGLAQAALHEIAGSGCDGELATLPAFFAGQVIRRHPDRRTLWVAPAADLYGPGLLGFGLDPTKLLLVETHQDAESLWALEEAARSGAVSLVIGEIDRLDLTASRRLQLAAEEKNCTILVLRRSRLAGNGEKHRHPSAAMTRWLISPLPSQSRDNRPGLGRPCWRLDLWRQRNGPPGCWDISLQEHAWQQTPRRQEASLEPDSTTAMAANDDSASRPHLTAGR
jgi:protein ImuA